MTVLEECSIVEALVSGMLTLEGDNRTEAGRVSDGDSPVVCDLD